MGLLGSRKTFQDDLEVDLFSTKRSQTTILTGITQAGGTLDQRIQGGQPLLSFSQLRFCKNLSLLNLSVFTENLVSRF